MSGSETSVTDCPYPDHPDHEYVPCPRAGCTGVLDYDGSCTAECDSERSTTPRNEFDAHAPGGVYDRVTVLTNDPSKSVGGRKPMKLPHPRVRPVAMFHRSGKCRICGNLHIVCEPCDSLQAWREGVFLPDAPTFFTGQVFP